MLRDLTWQKIDEMTRSQLAMFQALGDEVNLTQQNRREALDLDEPTWNAWVAFMADGPLPAAPAVPDMLRRLGITAYALSAAADPR